MIYIRDSSVQLVKLKRAQPTQWERALSDDDVHLSVCLSVCCQHQHLISIHQRAPLLVMIQQSPARGGGLPSRAIGSIYCVCAV